MIFEINKELLLYFNSLTNIEMIEKSVWIFADIPIFFLPIFLVTTWFYYSYINNKKEKKNLLLIFYSVLVAIIINLFIQQIIVLDRPEESIR